MQNKTLTTIIILIVLAVAGYLLWPNLRPAIAPTQNEITETPNTEAPVAKLMSIDSYVTQSISELSPIKETMGGKFYVTSIIAADGKGVVSYEDGHMAYTADFTYTSSDQTGHTITSFVIR